MEGSFGNRVMSSRGTLDSRQVNQSHSQLKSRNSGLYNQNRRKRFFRPKKRGGGHWTKVSVDARIIYEGDTCMLLSAHSRKKSVNTFMLKKNMIRREEDTKCEKHLFAIVAALSTPMKFLQFKIAFVAVTAWNGKMREVKPEIEAHIKEFKRAKLTNEGEMLENMEHTLKSDIELLNATKQLHYNGHEYTYCIKTFEELVQVVSVSGSEGIAILRAAPGVSESNARYALFNKNVVHLDNIPLSSASTEEFTLKMEACISDKAFLCGQIYECKHRTVQDTEIEYSLVLLWNERKPKTYETPVMKSSKLFLQDNAKPSPENITAVLEPPKFISSSKPVTNEAVGNYIFIDLPHIVIDTLSEEYASCGIPGSSKNKRKKGGMIIIQPEHISNKFPSGKPSNQTGDSSYCMVPPPSYGTCMSGMSYPFMMPSCTPSTSLPKNTCLTGSFVDLFPEYGRLKHKVDNVDKFYVFSRENCFIWGTCLSNFNLPDVLKPGISVAFIPGLNFTASKVVVAGEPRGTKEDTLASLHEWCIINGIQDDIRLQLLNAAKY